MLNKFEEFREMMSFKSFADWSCIWNFVHMMNSSAKTLLKLLDQHVLQFSDQVNTVVNMAVSLVVCSSSFV